MAAATASELILGYHRASDAGIRVRRAAFVEALIEAINPWHRGHRSPIFVRPLRPGERFTKSMSQSTSDRLAAVLADRYRIERELGAGGMATVYLAEDVKHHRKVAIKVLHAELSAILGPERFLKEIELTANLQHPHILPLFDSGSADGLLFYVMPYVDGETLRGRLSREKQLPIKESVRIATEVADALEYAHKHGVIHRDVKPENILLHEGRALVADFGIALAVEQAGGARMTQTGLSLGTPQYMSPEQAMGERTLDVRTDIYALGAVTYEMLAGEPPFTGPTAQAIVAKVMTTTPVPLVEQRKSVPDNVDYAVMTALEKLPADRFATAMEFANTLTGDHSIAHSGARPKSRATRRAVNPALLAISAIAVAALAIAGWSMFRHPPSARPLRASLLPPAGCSYDPVGTTNLVQLSPDGSALAFVASCGDTQSLWVTSLVTGQLRQLPGTAHAAYPFWSTDGASLGFFADGRLRRIDLQSNAVRDLAAAANGRGGSWNQRDVILYAPDIAGPLYQIAASGGIPKQVTLANNGAGISYRLPYFLPDGKQFLFSAMPLGSNTGTMRVGQLGSTDSRTLLDFPTNVAYADGRLLYARTGLLVAQPFDAGSATLSGPVVSLAPRVENFVFRYIANFTVSSAGDLLVYRPVLMGQNRVEWLDPGTGSVTTLLEPGAYQQVRVSPDGRRLLLERDNPDNSLRDLWLYDLAGKNWSRISARSSVYFGFAWSPDGTRIGYSSLTDSLATIISLDRAQSESFPLSGNAGNGSVTGDNVMNDWGSDGSFMGSRQIPATGWDLIVTTVSGAALQIHPLLATHADESSPRLSPDGRLLAYVSTTSGSAEVYVARMPGATAQQQVSQDGVSLNPGGHVAPMAWSRNGRILYYANGSGHLVSVAVTGRPTVSIGRPTLVAGAPDHIISLDAAPNGRLLLICDESPGQSPLEMIEHWPALAAKAP